MAGLCKKTLYLTKKHDIVVSMEVMKTYKFRTYWWNARNAYAWGEWGYSLIEPGSHPLQRVVVHGG